MMPKSGKKAAKWHKLVKNSIDIVRILSEIVESVKAYMGPSPGMGILCKNGSANARKALPAVQLVDNISCQLTAVPKTMSYREPNPTQHFKLRGCLTEKMSLWYAATSNFGKLLSANK